MDWSGRIALSAYRAAGYAVTPLTPLLVAIRSARGKEVRARRGERYGKSKLKRPLGPLVWVHAASVGETNAVMPLLEQIVEMGTNVLLTTTTVTSAQVAEQRLPKGAFHQFVPFDAMPFVRRFLDHWMPDLALFVESEMWPNIMSELNHRDVPLIVVNGRMSERSFDRWSRFPFAVREMFGNVPLCLTQSEEDGQRYAQLGVSHVEVTGNLKFDVPPPAADEAELTALRAAIGARPVWIAASTHPGEERVLAQAHRRMAALLPNILTIMVPRHPERGEELEKELSGIVKRVQRRSQDPALKPDTSIYLCDTLGELGLLYRLSRIAFLGGSLIPHGGQNPIEPARLGCTILHGPNTQNFADIYNALDAAGGAECLYAERDLIQALSRMFASPADVHRRSELARHALHPFAGALDRTVMALTPFLNPLKINAELQRSGNGADNGH